MSDQKNLEDIHSATSSRVSEGGLTPCDLLDGQTTDPCGQAHAHANPSRLQATKKVKKTNAIYGQYGSTSSASADLQQSLENKLAAQLPTGGLTMFIKGWKQKTTPSGRQYCQLAVSARPIKETDCGLWRTPDAHCDRGALSKERMSWKIENGMPIRLNDQVAMALWATPNCLDHMEARSLEALERAKKNGGCSNLKDQIHPAMWPTPQARDSWNAGYATRESYEAAHARHKAKGVNKQVALSDIAKMHMWPTPATRDHKDTGNLESSQVRKDGKERNDTLGRVAYGSTAQTESKGSLNPAFVCWLMGYPIEWENCADMVTLSSRKSRKNL